MRLIFLAGNHRGSTYSFIMERLSPAQCEVTNVGGWGSPRKLLRIGPKMQLCLFTKLLFQLGRDTINYFINLDVFTPCTLQSTVAVFAQT